MKKTTVSCLVFLIGSFIAAVSLAQVANPDVPNIRQVIPLGGNASVNAPDTITDEGLMNWKGPKSTANIYFRVSVAQDIKISLRLRVPNGESKIRIKEGENYIFKKVSNRAFDTIEMGTIHLKHAGHVKIELKGMSKTGAVYADVSDLIIQTKQPDADMAYVKQGSSFHFGRRGPSVHLRFTVPDDKKTKVKWFYNQIIVPRGQDVVGSYFMADGFGQGYFGMQVNSAAERRVLFSVWSPFNAEDPKSIPDSMRIKLVKGGAGVHIGEFGNEGSGGQSYMHYPWEAGKAYAFLLSAEPDPAKNSTTFTAYFEDVAAGKWFLVASFNRPQKATYLTSLYSFVENFEPENGDKTRKALFTNQWIGDNNNNWLQLTHAVYTGDATAKANYRKDYAGGVEGDKFYLQNGGFFDGFVKLNTPFARAAAGVKPVIDINKLPIK
jgi:hypothetical protein